ncbi:hypothetical protein B0J11DRAFT_224716 [Dendryphion nanum]|uniref:Uncharacterized protein n=1 Tax=Dendryphion nanum TaxID=256645 RepID=A0A9P9E4N8_9PLEO|nr:hypothetical protein B0J11DRAFT_224716 [Dendryphion nanum]
MTMIAVGTMLPLCESVKHRVLCVLCVLRVTRQWSSAGLHETWLFLHRGPPVRSIPSTPSKPAGTRSGTLTLLTLTQFKKPAARCSPSRVRPQQRPPNSLTHTHTFAQRDCLRLIFINLPPRYYYYYY